MRTLKSLAWPSMASGLSPIRERWVGKERSVKHVKSMLNISALPLSPSTIHLKSVSINNVKHTETKLLMESVSTHADPRRSVETTWCRPRSSPAQGSRATAAGSSPDRSVCRWVSLWLTGCRTHSHLSPPGGLAPLTSTSVGERRFPG